MKTKPYPKYKPSGVEWLGEVPEHWGVKRVKHLVEIRYGVGEPPEYVEEGVNFIRATNIDAGMIEPKNLVRINPEDIPYTRRTWLKAGDIVVVRSGAYTGDSAIIPEEYSGSIAGFDMVVSCCKACAKFFAYALLSKYLKDGQIYLQKLRAAQPHLNAEELGNCLFLFPPLSEQHAIANFLDRQIGRIDALIAKKERLLKLLAEQRAALISRAVTKGLDPSVKLKPSGVELLGNIPEHWEVKRVKQIANIRYGVGEPPEYVEDGVAFIRATNINAGMIESENLVRINPEDVSSTRRTWLNTGDIVVVRSGAYTGDSAIIPEEYSGSIAGFDMVVSCRKAASNFLAYALLSKYLKDGQIYLQKLRAAQPHLNAEELGNCLVFLPPLAEQKVIADYLDRETKKIDALSGKVREAIEKLREYRSALISAAVTGKIDVRGGYEF